MVEDPIREDIAFIRQTLEEGRSYARHRSPDFAVWGALVTLGYLGVYALSIGLWSLDPSLIWWPLVVIGWLFSARGLWSRRKCEAKPGPAARSLGALWLGFGITLVLFGLLQTFMGAHFEWMDVIVCALLAVCFFASSTIIGVGWLRFVAIGWWGAGFVTFLLKDTPEVLLAGAVFMFLLLCLPGLILWLRPSASNG
jgi:hypothetical protein